MCAELYRHSAVAACACARPPLGLLASHNSLPLCRAGGLTFLTVRVNAYTVYCLVPGESHRYRVYTNSCQRASHCFAVFSHLASWCQSLGRMYNRYGRKEQPGRSLMMAPPRVCNYAPSHSQIRAKDIVCSFCRHRFYIGRGE